MCCTRTHNVHVCPKPNGKFLWLVSKLLNVNQTEAMQNHQPTSTSWICSAAPTRTSITGLCCLFLWFLCIQIRFPQHKYQVSPPEAYQTGIKLCNGPLNPTTAQHLGPQICHLHFHCSLLQLSRAPSFVSHHQSESPQISLTLFLVSRLNFQEPQLMRQAYK